MSAVSSQPVRGSRFPTLEKYDVLEELGHGGMATVYRAKDLRLGRDVALKVIHPHLRDSAEAVRRFSIEARAVAKLRHRNIVEVYDVSGPTEPEQYLVVELLRGVTLRKLLEKHGALPPEIAAAIGVELLGALGHAHDEGVIHRDVKPENVILEHRAPPASSEAPEASEPSGRTTPQVSSAPGDRIVIKLTDFGIASRSRGATSTRGPTSSPSASSSTSAWWGTCHSWGRTRRRCFGACSTGSTRAQSER
jgi:serine/threonine-protein kinase